MNVKNFTQHCKHTFFQNFPGGNSHCTVCGFHALPNVTDPNEVVKSREYFALWIGKFSRLKYFRQLFRR